jgi:hypothetical protein
MDMRGAATRAGSSQALAGSTDGSIAGRIAAPCGGRQLQVSSEQGRERAAPPPSQQAQGRATAPLEQPQFAIPHPGAARATGTTAPTASPAPSSSHHAWRSSAAPFDATRRYHAKIATAPARTRAVQRRRRKGGAARTKDHSRRESAGW